LGNDIAPGVAWYLARHGSEYEVVHAHSHLYFSTNLAAAFRRFGDTPLAITNHGLFSQNASEKVFDWYLKTVGKWTFNSADVVFCYTEADEKRLREYGVTTDVAVVPNGIDTERFTPDGEVHKAMPRGPTVLFVGRLVEGKRPGDALEAFTGVVEKRPDVSMVFVGEGPLQEDLEREAESLGVSGFVRFLGHLEYDEMPSVYRGADVLVLPSRAEGLPRTVLEAMASGVPVVVSDLPQMRSAVGDGGLTVPVSQPESLERGLSRVLDGRFNPRWSVEGEYDWRTTVDGTTRRFYSLVR
jgi:glycosyltransferase involved in cell wall biosynthesis